MTTTTTTTNDNTRETNMTTTKTSTKTFSAIVEKANTDAIAAKASTAKEIEENESRVLELETASLIAEGGPDEFAKAWREGNTDIPPLAHAEAVSAALMASEVHEGAKARLASMVRSTPNVDMRAGTVVAEWLTDALSGIPVHVASVKVTEAPKKNELPLLLVSQLKATEQRPDGAIAGDVELCYFHDPKIHRELLEGTIEEAADRAGMRARVTARPSIDGQQLLKVRVENAFTDTPRISKPLGVERLATHIAGSIAGLVPGSNGAMGHDRVTLQPDKVTFAGFNFKAKVLGSEESAKTAREDGVRQTVATIRLGVDERRDSGVAEDFSKLVTQYVKDQENTFHSGHGRVSGAEVHPISHKDHRWAFEISLTLASSI